MNYKRIIASYLLSSLIPPLVLVIIGFVTEPEDCRECRMLLLVVTIFALLCLLLIHTLQFLGLFRLKNAFLDVVLLLVCSFSSTLIVAYSLLEEWFSSGETTFDWNLLGIPLAVNFAWGFFAFWAIKTSRKPVKQELPDSQESTTAGN